MSVQLIVLAQLLGLAVGLAVVAAMWWREGAR